MTEEADSKLHQDSLSMLEVEVDRENKKLKGTLSMTEEQLVKAKKQLQKFSQNSNMENSLNEEKKIFVCQALHGFEAEEENDLSFTEGEMLTITGVRNDGWWEAKNSQDETGFVPSTFLKIPDHMKSFVEKALETEKERKSDATDSIRSSSKKDQSQLLSTNQKELPEGFRPSILFENVNKSSIYSLGNFMIPKLDASGLSFKDIQYEKSSAQLKPNPALLQKQVILIAARHIPEPPNGYTVKSRHIRMCFHDGNRVLSNIHTVKAKWSDSSPKLWMFNLKVTGKDSCIEDGEIFIKCDKCVPTLGMLFELCIKYERAGGITSEMCAGWAFMKLLNDFGEPLKSKTYILKVQGSEPFAAYLSHINSPGKLGLFKKIINKQKVPRIVVSVCNSDRASNQQINYLPSSLIGPWSCIPILALCRKLAADDLLKRASFESTERIPSPVMGSILRVLNEPDLMDVLRVCWSVSMKSFNADDIRMDHKKTRAFRDLFYETVFLIMNTNGLPQYIFGESTSENGRRMEIDRLLSIQKSQEITLSEDVEFPPLSLNKLSTKIIF